MMAEELKAPPHSNNFYSHSMPLHEEYKIKLTGASNYIQDS